MFYNMLYSCIIFLFRKLQEMIPMPKCFPSHLCIHTQIREGREAGPESTKQHPLSDKGQEGLV